MLALLLEQTLLEFLQTPNKLAGMVVAALGLALAVLSRKIAKVARKQKPAANDPLYLSLLGIALCMIMVGLIMTIF